MTRTKKGTYVPSLKEFLQREHPDIYVEYLKLKREKRRQYMRDWFQQTYAKKESPSK